MLSLVLAAAVASANPGAASAQEQPRGAQVRVSATVVILRAETASETAEPGGLVRHVSRRDGAAPTIIFE